MYNIYNSIPEEKGIIAVSVVTIVSMGFIVTTALFVMYVTAQSRVEKMIWSYERLLDVQHTCAEYFAYRYVTKEISQQVFNRIPPVQYISNGIVCSLNDISVIANTDTCHTTNLHINFNVDISEPYTVSQKICVL